MGGFGILFCGASGSEEEWCLQQSMVALPWCPGAGNLQCVEGKMDPIKSEEDQADLWSEADLKAQKMSLNILGEAVAFAWLQAQRKPVVGFKDGCCSMQT